LLADTELKLCKKVGKRKAGMEVKGLKMNAEKTEVMFSCSTTVRVEKKGKWACGMYKEGVGSNSVLSACCQM